ncbi:MAG: ABC transporter substrate-binding protein [Clostridiaceae bacterium]|nr:ABC transporter substrate-binding protein [Clostridiaceae bacterium]
MKKTNKIMALVLAGAMAASMTACGSKAEETTAAATEAATEAAEAAETEGTETEAEASGKTYKIGVIQLVQHAALDKTNEGFVQALKDAGVSCEFDQQNAAGDQAACLTIAETLVNSDNDLIFAIATPAAQAVAGVTDSIPILVSAVTDPAASGLVESNEMPNCNVSGTSDLTPVKEQIELMQQILPEVKTVGLIYSSAEANSILQIDMAKEALDAAGIAYKDDTVSNSNEIQTVVESMVGNVDCIYSPTDNMIAAGMSTVSMVATENKIPIICGEEGMVEAGGLATYGIDYYQLGYMAGEQAVEILTKGADISTMPIGYLPAEKCTLSVNEEVAAELGIDVSGLK